MTIESDCSANDRTYVKLFILLFLPFCVAVLMYKRTDFFPWIGECNPLGYSSEHYLAYCHSLRYGDYEYYAFWHNTEPEQLDNLSKADVLFLGNSRTQFAFSTQAVSDFFSELNIPYFLFGFGLGGKSEIPEALIQKYQLKPKVLIINADPFFSNEFNDTFERAKVNDDATAWEHKAKIFLQKQQSRICDPNRRIFLLSSWTCGGEVKTLYRSRETGSWVVDYYLPDLGIPVSYDNSFFETIDQTLKIAERFITNSGVPKECIILTVTPSVYTPLQYAQTLADKAGIPAYFPELDNLVTIDESHLNKESAERWSQALLDMAEDNIRQCVS